VPVVLMSVNDPPAPQVIAKPGGQLAAAHPTPSPAKVPPALAHPAGEAGVQVPSVRQHAPLQFDVAQVEPAPWETPLWEAQTAGGRAAQVPSGLQQATGWGQVTAEQTVFRPWNVPPAVPQAPKVLFEHVPLLRQQAPGSLGLKGGVITKLSTYSETFPPTV
jgi:hypothetical protein